MTKAEASKIRNITMESANGIIREYTKAEIGKLPGRYNLTGLREVVALRIVHAKTARR